MYSIAKLNPKERSELFSETAAQKRMTTSIVEKDFWVTWTLSKIFENSELSKILRFKGGTTLSKVYGIIERFSEDIDLILNWKILTKEDPEGLRSNKKQRSLNDEIREAGRQYIQSHLTPLLASIVAPICTCESDGISGEKTSQNHRIKTGQN